MKLLLAGQGIIRRAAEHLLRKYTPRGLFDVTFVTTTTPERWSAEVSKAVDEVTEDLLVFALDDYLLGAPLQIVVYDSLLASMVNNPWIGCSRLCESSFYPRERRREHTPGLFTLEGADYTVTTQYCIWRRHVLQAVLARVRTPWEFELSGSSFYNRTIYRTLASEVPALVYPTNSALSARWEGVKVVGLPAEDIEALVQLGLLQQEILIYDE